MPFDSDRIFASIERMADLGPRRPGSPADRECEELLARELAALGFEVRLEPIPIVAWEAREAVLEVGDGSGLAPVEAQWIPYCAFTGERAIEAPLRWADPDALFPRGDWRGAVVVTEVRFPPLSVSLLEKISLGVHDPEGTLSQVRHPATWIRLNWHLYREAFRRGAVGFVGILADQPGGSCRMFAPYGFREKDVLDKPLPGVWVGREHGARLRELARSGEGRARLAVAGTRVPGLTRNVVGELAGSSDEVLVLSCHHDSPFRSPVEDASGCAVVLALARHFAERRDLRRRLLVLFTAGHFYGSVGTRTFLRDHAASIVRRAALEVSIEHIAREAVEDPSGRLVPSGRAEATGIFVPFNRKVADLVLASVRANALDRVVLLPPEGPLGDYPPTDGGDWHQAGVPIVQHISNPVYLLTADDALEWVARDRLANVAAAFAGILRGCDALPREVLSTVDLRARRLAMKLLGSAVRARATWFGLRPTT